MSKKPSGLENSKQFQWGVAVCACSSSYDFIFVKFDEYSKAKEYYKQCCKRKELAFLTKIQETNFDKIYKR